MTTIQEIAEDLRGLVGGQDWSGTVTELTAALGGRYSPAHLAVWLRRHEPALWWDFAIQVRFTRTRRRRLVHLSRRDPVVAAAVTATNKRLAVTAERGLTPVLTIPLCARTLG
jgi:hypothetical protein